MWKQITKQNRPYSWIANNELCFFYTFYFSEGYYVLNQLIKNFKKPINQNGQNYKKQAMLSYSQYLSLFPFEKDSIITPAVTSKKETDDDYDARLDISTSLAAHNNINITYDKLLTVKQTTLKAQYGGSRDPEEIIDNLEYCSPNIYQNKTIYIVDDVITTGAHYRAMSNKIKQYCPTCNIIGLFLGLTVSLEPFTNKWIEFVTANPTNINILLNRYEEKYSKGEKL